MYKRRRFGAMGLSTVPRRRCAVVIGGSLAGMLAARVLSEHFDEVTVLERDELSGPLASRKGIPQARHAHALMARGCGVMERLLPGMTAELVRAGAEVRDATLDVLTMSPQGWYVRCAGGPSLLSCSRDLIDYTVRTWVAAIPNVRIRHGVEVDGLIPAPITINRSRVAGVRFRSRPVSFVADRVREELAADLVVVADGRNSRLPDWLTAIGYDPPQETVVNSFQGYASRRYRPAPDFKADWRAVYIQQAPPEHPRGGLIAPVEGGLWLVSLIGGDGEYPPVDDEGFLEFARSLRSPVIYNAIAAAEPLTPITGNRATANRTRHYDRLPQFPEGLVALGDAVRAFNPVYGQGMSAAAIGAEVLEQWLRDAPSRSGPGRGRVFQCSLARATAAAWQLSTGADYRFRTTEGTPPGRLAPLLGRHLASVMRASTRRPEILRRQTRVFHLLAPMSSLFSPGLLARLAWDRLIGGASPGDKRLDPRRKESDESRDQRHVRQPSVIPRSPRAAGVEPSLATTPGTEMPSSNLAGP
jgi:2-polyprenyl-6-methoxyphenol hydroxylase-like FAD-dependent oxidoreductase